MYAFEYHRPQSLAGAAADLANPDAKALAGGMTLLPTMKQRLASPTALIDLKSVPELAGVAREGDNLVIGAMTRHADVAGSEVVRAAIPALATLAGLIGDAHVRNMGTIGGSVANNDPSADYPAAALALGATIITNKRRIPAQDFFTGLFETALETGELITQVSFPIPQRAAYMKFRNPASRYALVGVFVAKTAGGVRVAVTGAGSNGVFRAEQFEAALNANFSAAALDDVSVPASGLNSDLHADADYRAHLIGVMARRAVEAAA
jgi:aerobic carbon-monoxide dehydrogenase medium subunit